MPILDEIKGKYKFVLRVLALVFILFTGIYIYTGKVNSSSLSENLFMAVSVLILFGSALTVFLYILNSFRKELYEDSGYLTFTLPLTGNQLVGSKLIVALLWFFILVMFIILYNILVVAIFSPFGWHLSKLFSVFTQGASFNETIFNILNTIFSGVSLLILIYFSIALSKVTIRNRKIGGLWFVIFLLLIGILGFGKIEISNWFPYYFDFNTFHVKTLATLNEQWHVATNQDEFSISINATGNITANIAAGIYHVVTMVALFLGCGYLLEKKIDL